MPVPRRLSEAAIAAAQAVIIPTAAISIAVSALALMPRKYITQQEAAEYLGVTDRTIRTKIAEGVITGYRMPGRSQAIRVDLAEIERLMQPIPTAVVIKKQPVFGPNARIVAVDPEELDEQSGGDRDDVTS